MPFSISWHTLLDELEELPEGATFITPLSHKQFRITDVQEHRVVIQFENKDEKRPLQRDQFETLYRRIQDAPDGFDLDRLPPDADPYPTVLSVHPRFEVNEDTGIITETEDATTTQPADTANEPDDEERTEPEGLDVYSDALLLIDALERHDVTDLPELDSEYVRKADVDEDVKESRLKGLKDRLATFEDEEAEELRGEIEELEQRIDDLTSFRTGAELASAVRAPYPLPTSLPSVAPLRKGD